MLQSVIKVCITAIIIVAISEIGRRSSLWASVLASLPLTSLLAFIWLYRDTGNVETIASLSQSIFWLVFASLPLFLILPALLRNGVPFWSALGVACAVTVGAYFGLIWCLARFNIHL